MANILEENAKIDNMWAKAGLDLYDCTCVDCPPKTREKCPRAWELGNIGDVCLNPT